MEQGASDPAQSAALWLRTGYVPGLRGPGPWLTFLSLFGLGSALVALYPGPETPFLIGLLLSAGTIGYTLKSRPWQRDTLMLAVMSTLVVAWVAWLATEPAYHDTLLSIAAVGAASLVVGLTRWVAQRRFTLRAIAECSADWTIGELVAYAEFLIDRKPCSGAWEAARRLYRTAAEKVLEKPWHERRDIKVIERFANLLTERGPNATEVAVARIWRDHARNLGQFAIGPDEPPTEGSGFRYDGDGAPDRVSFDDLGFHRGVPVWRLRVDNPDSLLDGEAVFRAFLLPEGALLACLVRFESVVDRTVLVHRIFDVTDPTVENYMAGSEHHLRWRIEMYDAKQVGNADLVPEREPDAVREVNLKDSGLMGAFEQVLAHNAALGVHADVGSAYAFLTSTFRECAANYGIEAAWSTLEAACTRVPD